MKNDPTTDETDRELIEEIALRLCNWTKFPAFRIEDLKGWRPMFEEQAAKLVRMVRVHDDRAGLPSRGELTEFGGWLDPSFPGWVVSMSRMSAEAESNDVPDGYLSPPEAREHARDYLAAANYAEQDHRNQ